ncbi:uncharacterized protein LOC144153128 [Haemaphysalis longicornis]
MEGAQSLPSAGFKKYGSSDELARDPLKHLLSVCVLFRNDPCKACENICPFDRVYVAANADAERDPVFRAEALQCFADLEAGQPEAVAQWEQWRQLSLDGYSKLYQRLGISFDVLDAESRHSQAALDLLERLRAEARLAARGAAWRAWSWACLLPVSGKGSAPGEPRVRTCWIALGMVMHIVGVRLRYAKTLHARLGAWSPHQQSPGMLQRRLPAGPLSAFSTFSRRRIDVAFTWLQRAGLLRQVRTPL